MLLHKLEGLGDGKKKNRYHRGDLGGTSGGDPQRHGLLHRLAGHGAQDPLELREQDAVVDRRRRRVAAANTVVDIVVAVIVVIVVVISVNGSRFERKSRGLPRGHRQDVPYQLLHLLPGYRVRQKIHALEARNYKRKAHHFLVDFTITLVRRGRQSGGGRGGGTVVSTI